MITGEEIDRAVDRVLSSYGKNWVRETLRSLPSDERVVWCRSRLSNMGFAGNGFMVRCDSGGLWIQAHNDEFRMSWGRFVLRWSQLEESRQTRLF